MKKPNQLYNILEECQNDIGLRDHDEIQTYSRKIGEQWAVSEAQAVARYCYKTKRKAWDIYEWEGDTGATVRLVAELKR